MPHAIRPQPGEVVIIEAGLDHQTHIVFDERREGEDPLLASLGAGTAAAVRMVASRRAIPLTRVVVRLRHSHRPGHDDIELDVILEGPMDEAERRILMEIAEHYPVHQSLGAGLDLATKMRLPH